MKKLPNNLLTRKKDTPTVICKLGTCLFYAKVSFILNTLKSQDFWTNITNI